MLAVAGDITTAEAREKVQRYFGDIPPGPPVSHARTWIARMSDEHRETVEDRVPQARLYKIWNVPGYGEAATDHFRLASGLLSSGRSSRLYKRLVYDDQIATQVGAYLDEREIGSQFVVIATAKQGVDLRRVEKAVEEELDRFLQEGPTSKELERIKTQFFAGFIRGIERIGGFGGKSDILATSQTYAGNPHGYKQRLENIERASSEDLLATMRSLDFERSLFARGVAFSTSEPD